MQMVEAQNAHRCRVMGNHRYVAIAGEPLGLVVERDLPPVDFAAAQRGHRRKRIQCYPLDPIEMCDLGSGSETDGSRCARLVKRESFVGGAGATDMLLRQKAIRAAADDFSNRLE